MSLPNLGCGWDFLLGVGPSFGVDEALLTTCWEISVQPSLDGVCHVVGAARALLRASICLDEPS